MAELTFDVRERYADMLDDLREDGGPQFDREVNRTVENVIHQMYQNSGGENGQEQFDFPDR